MHAAVVSTAQYYGLLQQLGEFTFLGLPVGVVLVLELQEAAGHIAADQELPVALAQLMAVRHSAGGGPVAADTMTQLCRAAACVDAAARAALASTSAGGQLASADAAGVAVHLQCLRVALSVALPAGSAGNQQVVPLVESATQLAIMALQTTKLQVGSRNKTPGPYAPVPLCIWYCSDYSRGVGTAEGGRTASTLHRSLCLAGRMVCPAGGSALVHHCCDAVWQAAANGCAACHGSLVPLQKGVVR
jgi:hypothetical protein